MSFLLTPAAFIIIIFGAYSLKRGGFFGENDYRPISKIVLNITLPAAVLHAFDGFERDMSLFLVVLIGCCCSLLPLLVMYLLTRGQERGRRVFSMINAAGFNIGCFSLPLIQSFFGPAGAAIACMFDTGNAVMVTGGSFGITTSLLQGQKTGAGREDGQPALPPLWKRFLTSVPFDAYMLMLLLYALNIAVPEWILTLTKPIANANGFMAMLMVGLMFKPEKNPVYLTDTAKVVAVRLVMGACFSLLLFWCTPFSYEVRRVLTVVVFAPVSALAPAFTEKSGGNGALSSFANSISIFASLLVMTCLAAFLGV